MPDDRLRQLTEHDLQGMSAEEIVQAREAGQLNELLGMPAPAPPFSAVDDEGKPRAITEEDLVTMSPEAIVKARRAGQLRHFGYAPGSRR